MKPHRKSTLPARTALPSGVVIEKVPLLGTTWYERGTAYWLRRLGMVAMMALILALVGAMLEGFFGAIRATSQTGFYVVIGLEAGYSLAIIAFLAVRVAKHWNDMDKPPAGQPAAIRTAGSAGAVLGTVARAGLFVGQLFLVLSSLLFAGLYIALLLAMLMPETIWERPARLRLIKQLGSQQAIRTL